MGLPADTAFNLVWDFSNFQWYMVPFLLVVIYMISKEVQKENWSAILAAIAFWLMDWVNELWNAVIYHFKGAPFWSTPGVPIAPGVYAPNSSLVILVGLNIEITFMFLMMGFVSTKMFKGTIQEELRISDSAEQKLYRRKRITNRILIILSMAALCVIVEIILNLIGILVWEWNGAGSQPNLWSISNPILIYIIGYLPFWGMSALIYDMKKRWLQVVIVGTMSIIVIIAFVTMAFLGWLAPPII
ncbi:MAG: hypothetical protein JW776_13485 [Candidatus Lokiarchaeota archaeon]|nr:hypothetical protein [Candidatus Lokiarchaeota archaeon]